MTPESYNTPMGVVKTIRTSLRATHDVFVCEMGAKYVGDIRELCELVQPDDGIVTSIGEQHLETFGSIDNIIRTKYELADGISPDGKLFVNLSSPTIAKKSACARCDHLRPFAGSGLSCRGYFRQRSGNVLHALPPRGTAGVFHAPDRRGERCEYRRRACGRV